MNKSLLMLAMTGALITSCGEKTEKYPNTGDAGYEKMVGAMTSIDEVEVGKAYYTTTGLSVRDSKGLRLGLLNRHDKVIIASLDGIEGKEDYVEVTFQRKSYHDIQSSDKYFVSLKYLLDKVQDNKDFDGKYFVIQNLATERLRVYEKSCNLQDVCINKMVMETEMAIGEDDEVNRTYVGSYRITDWWKFYQDFAAHYPSWYRDDYPAPPEPGSSFLQWLKNKYMPFEGGERKGDIRGAFGWYAAWLGPNHNAQWMHGTVGWGADKDKTIKFTKKTLANLFTNPRSSGCSRLNNEAIAYLRDILPVGTPIIRVYAKEALLDRSRRDYRVKVKPWSYILTKDDAYSTKNYSSAREEVESRNIPLSRRLETGTFVMDTYPTMFNFTPGQDLSARQAKTKTTGNVYRIDANKMRGILYVDAGLLEHYDHPNDPKIGRGGFRDEIAPSYMIMDRSVSKMYASYVAPENQPENDNSGVVYAETVKVDTTGVADLSGERNTFSTEIADLHVVGNTLERNGNPKITLQLGIGVYAKFLMSPVGDEDWDLVVSYETLNSRDSRVRDFVERFFKRGISAPVKVSIGSNEVTISKKQGRNIDFSYRF